MTLFQKDWLKAREETMQRKSQLEGYLMNGRSFDDRRCEVEAWLNRAEAKLQRLPSVGQTLDIIEAQLKEQKVKSNLISQLLDYRLNIGLTFLLISYL